MLSNTKRAGVLKLAAYEVGTPRAWYNPMKYLRGDYDYDQDAASENDRFRAFQAETLARRAGGRPPIAASMPNTGTSTVAADQAGWTKEDPGGAPAFRRQAIIDNNWGRDYGTSAEQFAPVHTRAWDSLKRYFMGDGAATGDAQRGWARDARPREAPPSAPAPVIAPASNPYAGPTARGVMPAAARDAARGTPAPARSVPAKKPVAVVARPAPVAAPVALTPAAPAEPRAPQPSEPPRAAAPVMTVPQRAAQQAQATAHDVSAMPASASNKPRWAELQRMAQGGTPYSAEGRAFSTTGG